MGRGVLFLVTAPRLFPQNRRDDSARPVDSGHENLADVGRFTRAGVESKGCRKILTARLQRITQRRVYVPGSHPDEVNRGEELRPPAFP